MSLSQSWLETNYDGDFGVKADGGWFVVVLELMIEERNKCGSTEGRRKEMNWFMTSVINLLNLPPFTPTTPTSGNPGGRLRYHCPNKNQQSKPNDHNQNWHRGSHSFSVNNPLVNSTHDNKSIIYLFNNFIFLSRRRHFPSVQVFFPKMIIKLSSKKDWNKTVRKVIRKKWWLEKLLTHARKGSHFSHSSSSTSSSSSNEIFFLLLSQ